MGRRDRKCERCMCVCGGEGKMFNNTKWWGTEKYKTLSVPVYNVDCRE